MVMRDIEASSVGATVQGFDVVPSR